MNTEREVEEAGEEHVEEDVVSGAKILLIVHWSNTQ